ncbi:MAG: response regulator [Candidatus Omnitrophota bacterium]|jgi:CheY-like chemotaxis protein|nr:response regulator [Candidatus Omnitrophota bacterium]
MDRTNVLSEINDNEREGRKKILVVDDEKGFTAMLSLNLETAGQYEVRVENNPQHALEVALKFRPDIILLDIIMPNAEGPDIAFEFKNHPRLRDIPIVFLTATVTQEEVEAHGGKIGGHSFVAKPSNLNVLLDSIERNTAGVF